jgi:hypothetical protein
MNPKTGSSLKLNILELRNAASSTTAILMVLFATSIVLRSFSGLLYNFRIVFDFSSLLDLRFSSSSGLKEKNATSEADMRADPTRRIMMTRKPITILKSGELIPIPEIRNKYDSG